MAHIHVHVVENEVECLPESEPACFASRVDAETYAHEIADELREAGYRMSGTRHDGYRALRGGSEHALELIDVPALPCPDAI